jgi:hypothetical protein
MSPDCLLMCCVTVTPSALNDSAGSTYPIWRIASRAISSNSTVAREVISPARTTWSLFTSTSQATLLRASLSKCASRMESAMKSQTLSG